DRVNVAAVLGVVDLSELLPRGTVFYFFSSAFQHDGFVGFFRADDHVRVRCDVLCLARTRASAEPEGILAPDSPNDHEMRAAIRTRRGYPVVVRFFEAFESPGPGLESA